MPPFPAPNGELIVYVLSLVVIGILGLAADTVGAAGFVEFAKWATVGYLLSRGLAKLRNVTER